MKKSKKVFLSILCGLLALILAACIVFFWYYPHFLSRKHTVAIQPESSGKITMMSCNLRCITPLDLGKKSWYYRADLVLSDIESAAPGIIGFQEATKWQYEYMVDALTGYDSVITYRDSTFNSEGCPIFYHTESYTLVDKGSFWLSDTPEVMSKGWDAACYRICSYVILTDNTTGKDFVVFNTHLDHVSDTARINGIKVVLDKIAQFGGLPSVIMGDFNALEGSETYLQVTENFLDARYQVEDIGQEYTYQNWGNADSFKRLDYFMISMDGIDVSSYCVLPALHDGVYSTDHCPIVLQATLS